jgi:hypothetical protein
MSFSRNGLLLPLVGVAGLLLCAEGMAQEATLRVDRERRELVLTLGPVDLPPAAAGGHPEDHGGHVHPPPEPLPLSPQEGEDGENGQIGQIGQDAHPAHPGAIHLTPRLLTVPASVSIRGYRIELVDRNGDPVPRAVLHHVDVIRPEWRELFLPVAQRLFAAGQDTGDFRSPLGLLGLAVSEGEVWEVLAMLHNPTGRAFEGVEVRVRFAYHPRLPAVPLVSVLPFHLNVTFPAGRTDWDLPPGTHEWSWEGSPAVPVRVLALGGHLHAGAAWIRLEDMTRGRILWEGVPTPSDGEEPGAMPVGRLFLRGGVPLRPDRVYRVTARYTNHTDAPIPSGGMGVVGGIAALSRGADWPEVDPSDPLYRLDQAYYRSLANVAPTR